LLALDASVVVAGPEGARTVSIADLYLLPQEDTHNETALAPNDLITEVVIPVPAPGTLGTYIKSAERQAWDFALVSVAVQLAFDGETIQTARVSLGGVAPVPWQATAAEETLTGQSLTEATIERAAQAATSGARPLAQNEFKVDLAQGLVRQALRDLAP
jgi:xanthine dehydrogenase YagS FAD-binding subunit